MNINIRCPLFSPPRVQISKFQNTVLDVNLDQYYGLIEEDTFETEFISFSVADAKAFMRAHEHFQANSTLAGLAAADVQRLSGLESQLEEVMSRVKGDKEDGVFVKTTCRSAKDTAAFDSNFRYLFHLHSSHLPLQQAVPCFPRLPQRL